MDEGRRAEAEIRARLDPRDCVVDGTQAQIDFDRRASGAGAFSCTLAHVDDRRTGRRFRRRLLAVMLPAGRLPPAAGGLVVGFGLSRMLSPSLGGLDPLLERAQEAARDPRLARELSQARVELLQ